MYYYYINRSSSSKNSQIYPTLTKSHLILIQCDLVIATWTLLHSHDISSFNFWRHKPLNTQKKNQHAWPIHRCCDQLSFEVYFPFLTKSSIWQCKAKKTEHFLHQIRVYTCKGPCTRFEEMNRYKTLHSCKIQSVLHNHFKEE